MIRKVLFIWMTIIGLLGCNSPSSSSLIKLGLDVLRESQFDLLQGKRIGVITNQTGVDSQGRHIIDLLHQASGVELVAIFAPEHGFRGNVEGGDRIDTQTDPKTGVPIYGIYGATQKPTAEMLQNIDGLIFDIQDVGARFYTYISTMSLCMEAAAEHQIEFIVLDRPNPITGTLVEGPVLEPEYRSFVGMHPIALRHGMTVAELAQMFNGEGWLANGVKAKLTVIPMENWKRDSWYDELGLKWIKPSPNMPSAKTALLYPGMGLLESCNVSEGRGTTRPFENIGAPWLNSLALMQMLNDEKIVGIKIDTTCYVPVDLPGMAMNPKYEGERCNGLLLGVTDPRDFLSVQFGIQLLGAIKKLHPDQFAWRSAQSALRLFGDAETIQAIDEGKSAAAILQSWQVRLEEFNKIREKYLLYD